MELHVKDDRYGISIIEEGTAAEMISCIALAIKALHEKRGLPYRMIGAGLNGAIENLEKDGIMSD